MYSIHFIQQVCMISTVFFTTFVFTPQSFADVPMAVVKNSLYVEECGSCHWPFLAGLLPASSWNILIKGLNDHFGEDASLDVESTTSLMQYLKENAADKNNAKRSRKLVRSISSGHQPIRVTEIPYIIRKHRELRREVFKRPGVKSFSNCASCHPQALKGDFEEDNVRIPGHIGLSSGGGKKRYAISLADAIGLAQRKYPGTFLEAEVERGVYEVKLRTNDGFERKVYINPANGMILDNSNVIVPF